MEKSIHEVMTPNPRTITSSTPVIEAARIMKEEDVGSIPIVDDGRLSGLLTDRDIVLRVVAERGDPQTTTAGNVASGNIVTIDPDQGLDEALRMMAQHQVRRLPVVEED